MNPHEKAFALILKDLTKGNGFRSWRLTVLLFLLTSAAASLPWTKSTIGAKPSHERVYLS
jgi:hypothetical protein